LPESADDLLHYPIQSVNSDKRGARERTNARRSSRRNLGIGEVSRRQILKTSAR
jgi:hypothetical protein